MNVHTLGTVQINNVANLSPILNVSLCRVGKGWMCECHEFHINGCCTHFVQYAVAKIRAFAVRNQRSNSSSKGDEFIGNCDLPSTGNAKRNAPLGRMVATNHTSHTATVDFKKKSALTSCQEP